MTNKKQNDTTAAEVARIFKCSDSYVRKLLKDEDSKKYKGERAKKIRSAYWKLKSGKSKLLQSVEKLVPFQKAS